MTKYRYTESERWPDWEIFELEDQATVIEKPPPGCERHLFEAPAELIARWRAARAEFDRLDGEVGKYIYGEA